MGKEILEPCWVNKEVFSITTSFRVVVTMTIWAPCKPSSSMHLWTMEVNSWAYHFWNNLCVTCGRPFPFGLFLVPIFHHFGVSLHLCFPESCTYIRLGSMKLMSFLPLHHPGSTFAPLFLSLAFCFSPAPPSVGQSAPPPSGSFAPSVVLSLSLVMITLSLILFPFCLMTRLTSPSLDVISFSCKQRLTTIKCYQQWYSYVQSDVRSNWPVFSLSSPKPDND